MADRVKRSQFEADNFFSAVKRSESKRSCNKGQLQKQCQSQYQTMANGLQRVMREQTPDAFGGFCQSGTNMVSCMSRVGQGCVQDFKSELRKQMGGGDLSSLAEIHPNCQRMADAIGTY